MRRSSSDTSGPRARGASAASAGTGPRSTLGALVSLARPSHWIKNGFVLAPLLFTYRTATPPVALHALVACAAFCLASSAVYAANDVVDRERDRRNPERRHRPLARGAVGVRAALALAASCAAAALGLCGLLPLPAGAAIGGYLVLQAAYCWRLKRIVLIDVMAIAAGFMLRIAAGAAAIGVALSPWMVHVAFFLSLFLGFSKRRHEIGASRHGGRRVVLGRYSATVLDLLVAITATLAILAYALYVIQPGNAASLRSEALLWTLPVVVYGVLRYLVLVLRGGRGGDVAEVVLHDRPLQAAIAVWIAAIVLLIALAR